jgi:hypothetical protein
MAATIIMSLHQVVAAALSAPHLWLQPQDEGCKATETATGHPILDEPHTPKLQPPHDRTYENAHASSKRPHAVLRKQGIALL